MPGTPAGFPEPNLVLGRAALQRCDETLPKNRGFSPRGPPLNSLRRSHLRAARPRIAITLFFSCCKRLFGQQTEVTLPRSFAESIFYDPIFQRVKTDHHHTSLWLQNPRRRIEQRLQIVQFAVYEDSKSLKSSGRRMNPLGFH